jgi:hypothetical protein
LQAGRIHVARPSHQSEDPSAAQCPPNTNAFSGRTTACRRDQPEAYRRAELAGRYPRGCWYRRLNAAAARGTSRALGREFEKAGPCPGTELPMSVSCWLQDLAADVVLHACDTSGIMVRAGNAGPRHHADLGTWASICCIRRSALARVIGIRIPAAPGDRRRREAPRLDAAKRRHERPSCPARPGCPMPPRSPSAGRSAHPPTVCWHSAASSCLPPATTFAASRAARCAWIAAIAWYYLFIKRLLMALLAVELPWLSGHRPGRANASTSTMWAGVSIGFLFLPSSLNSTRPWHLRLSRHDSSPRRVSAKIGWSKQRVVPRGW